LKTTSQKFQVGGTIIHLDEPQIPLWGEPLLDFHDQVQGPQLTTRDGFGRGLGGLMEKSGEGVCWRDQLKNQQKIREPIWVVFFLIAKINGENACLF